MRRRPPRSTRTDTLFPYTTLVRSDGRMGRLQAEGQPDYSIVDGEQMATHVVMVEDRMIMTMDPAELAAANGASKTDAEPVDLGAAKIGERERSEERRVGKECVSTVRARGSPEH